MDWIYFGTPGDLSRLARPRDGIDSPRDQRTSAVTLAGGGAVVHALRGGLRTYTLRWSSLEDTHGTTLAVLEEYAYGLRGSGPFALLDPGRLNLLTTNQSSGTGALADTTGFTASAGTLASSTAVARRGTRSLLWTLAAGTTATLALDAAASWWPGTPAMEGVSYALSLQALGGGTDLVVELTAQLQWLDAAGVTLSTSSGTPVSTSGDWTAVSAVAVAPAGAVYLLPLLAVTGATVGAGATVALDELQLESGGVASGWRPGTGVYPVAIVGGMDESQPWADPGYREGVTLILQEVGSQ
ncbi:MAG: hypothetical protein OEW44_00030 [Gemmatimonadota bacterium]|nr:hypothetical protein [Gemmatimonadota bacterium]